MAETEAKHKAMAECKDGQSLRAVPSLPSRAVVLRHLRTPLYANAYYLMANTVVVGLSGFLFWTVAARLYSPAQVGIGSALIAASTLLMGISALGLGTGLIRFLPTSKDPWRMISACLTIPTVVSALSGVVFLAGARFWSPELGFVSEQPLLFVCFVVFTAGGTVSAFLDNAFIAQRRANYTLLKNVAIGFGRIPLLMWLPFLVGAFAIFGVIGLVTIPVVGVGVWWLRRRTRRASTSRKWLDRRLLADLMGFSLRNYVADLIYTAPSMLLPLVVLSVLGPEANGYFYISWMLGGLLCLVPGALARSLLAEGSHFESHVGSDAIRAVKLSVVLVLPAAVAVFVLAEKLLLVFGRAYAEGGVSLLRILVLAAVPIILNTVYFTVRRVQRQITTLIALSALIAAATLGLSYLLMPRVGLSGVGIAWLGSQTTAAAIIAYWLWEQRRSQATHGR